MNGLLHICSAQYTTPLCEYSKFYGYYCGKNSKWQTEVTQRAQFYFLIPCTLNAVYEAVHILLYVKQVSSSIGKANKQSASNF